MTENTSARRSAWLNWSGGPEAAAEASVNLFCLPYAGGAASAYAPWRSLLPPEVGLCPIQLPGRAARAREAPLTSLAEMVTGIADALMPALVRAPFALFGHSLGALLSYEVARELIARGGPKPSHLFLSSSLPPNAAGRNGGLSKLPHAELVAKLRAMGGLPSEIIDKPELLEFVLPIFRADATAWETWAPPARPPIDIPILAMGGREDDSPPFDRLGEWRHETRGSFSVRGFPAGHFYWMSEPRPVVDAVLGALGIEADA